MSAEMACSKCALEARLSGGDGSRITLDTEKLQRDGWSVEKKGKSYVFFSPSPEKKRFKSSSDVAAHLQNNNMLTLLLDVIAVLRLLRIQERRAAVRKRKNIFQRLRMKPGFLLLTTKLL